jgi:hypothetical protein
MTSNRSREIHRENTTKILLSAFFMGLFAGFIWIMDHSQQWGQLDIGLWEVFLLGFATLRLGRMISYDLIMKPLRSPFTQTVADSTGAGETVEPKGVGAVHALGEMFSCPICTGTWVAALLVYGLYLCPQVMHVFILVMGVIGIAEGLNALLETLSWLGQLLRKFAGEKEKAAGPRQ